MCIVICRSQCGFVAGTGCVAQKHWACSVAANGPVAVVRFGPVWQFGCLQNSCSMGNCGDVCVCGGGGVKEAPHDFLFVLSLCTIVLNRAASMAQLVMRGCFVVVEVTTAHAIPSPSGTAWCAGAFGTAAKAGTFIASGTLSCLLPCEPVMVIVGVSMGVWPSSDRSARVLSKRAATALLMSGCGIIYIRPSIHAYSRGLQCCILAP
jgi:hypothetical protein